MSAHQFRMVWEATVSAGVLAGNLLRFTRFFLRVAHSFLFVLVLSSFPPSVLHLLFLVGSASLWANVGPSRSSVSPFALKDTENKVTKSNEQRNKQV